MAVGVLFILVITLQILAFAFHVNNGHVHETVGVNESE